MTHKQFFKKLGKLCAMLVALMVLAWQSACGAKAPTYRYAEDWVPPTPRMVELAEMQSTTSIDTDATSEEETEPTTAEQNAERVSELIAILTDGAGTWPDAAVAEWLDAHGGMSAKLAQAIEVMASDSYIVNKKSAVRVELEILAHAVAARASYDGAAPRPLEAAATLDALVHDFAAERYITDEEARYFVSLYDGDYFPAGRHPHVIS